MDPEERTTVVPRVFTLSQFTEITLNGVKGKRLVYDTPTKPGHPEMHGEARFFMFGDRLYVADAVVEMAGGEAKLEHFFSSLEIKE